MTDPGPEAYPTVRSHFYQLYNGTIYTYSRFADNRFDTIRCTLIVGQFPRDTNKLVITSGTQASPTQQVLYYLGFSNDHSGSLAAVLSNDTSSILALDGSLSINTNWMADPIRGIVATVVDHYDEYWLPDRSAKFEDVLVVKYHTIGEADNVYTLRFFAKNQGLIFERRMVGPNTEIGNLQLLNVQSPTPVNGVDLPADILHTHHHSQYMMMWQRPGEDD